MSGFLKLSRSFFEHEFWDHNRVYSKAEAFLDLIQRANWSGGKVSIGNAIIRLEPGEQVASLRFLSTRWSWSPMKTKRFLDVLKTEHMTRQQTRQGQTIITLCNYDRYNSNDCLNETANETPNETVTRQQRDSNETKQRIIRTKEQYITPLPPTGGKLTRAEKKLIKVEANTQDMERIGTWFKRKPSTLWTIAEKEALDMIAPSNDEIATMEARYKSGDQYLRKDLITLLNNWHGELDKAQAQPQTEEAPREGAVRSDGRKFLAGQWRKVVTSE